MRKLVAVVGIVTVLAFATTAAAQSPAEVERLKKEVELLKKENELLKKENTALKADEKAAGKVAIGGIEL
jgi:hypothetical protein